MLRNSAILGQHFAFAHGRSGVLQQFLLTQSDCDRLLGAHDRAEVHAVLLELPLTKLLDPSDRTTERVIGALASWVQREVRGMVSPEKRATFDILWLEGDAPLLAALLKERRGLTSPVSRRPEPPATALPPDAWERAVLEDDSSALPAAWRAALQDLRAEDPADPAIIDARVAAAMAAHSLALARRSGSPLVTRYVRHGIDIQNIRTALRLEEAPEEEADLLPGGTIEPGAFAGERSVADIVRTHGFYALADTLEQPGRTGSDVERALSDIRAEDIALLWNEPLKLEPVFAFAATALTQLHLLRALLIGKQSGLSPQDVKRLLPPFLSASHYHA